MRDLDSAPESPSAHWSNYARILDREPLRSKTFDALDFAAMEAVATFHRGGRPCRVNKSIYAYGGDNLVLEILFDDQMVWMVRLRLHERKFLRPRGDVDKIFVTEVATLRFLKEKTNIPVPTVFVFDAHYQNEVGQPYMMMEAMPGKRLWGGPQTDYISDQYKAQVYQQFEDMLLELYSHPFDEIGMLWPQDETDPPQESVRVGPIVYQHARIQDFGPFADSLCFYQTRNQLLLEYYRRRKQSNSTEEPDFDAIESSTFKRAAIPYIAEHSTSRGPFFLAHPDFQVQRLLNILMSMQITNCLFDDNYNITAVLDWTGCQILPFESFAFPPMKVVPYDDKFLVHQFGQTLRQERRIDWSGYRTLFLRVMEERQMAWMKENGTRRSIASMMQSPRSYFAHILNWEGIVGFNSFLPRTEFLDWVDLPSLDGESLFLSSRLRS